MYIIDRLNYMILADDLPFGDIHPEAPQGFVDKLTKGLNLAHMITVFFVILGVIIAAAGLAISRREGSSEESTQTALRIGFACMLLGSAVSVVGFFL